MISRRTCETSFGETIISITKELQQEGFGIITRD